MCNFGISTSFVYLRPSILRQGKCSEHYRTGWTVVTLYSTGIFRTQGIFRRLSNIYDGKFYSKPCLTLAYLDLPHIKNPSYIQNTVKHLLWNILFKTMCNADISRILLYSQLWCILKTKHIQNPAKYLRWSTLSRTLCHYSMLISPIYSNFWNIQDPSMLATP